ncbi:TPA: sulfite exporter TauE/SafE family protein [Streptococcus suis]|uniref:cytochrome c biogenesis CcdA family protein n=1 Tax=Streptococcus suis TaxID=1307 RepID=UPI000416B717|nr:cytochrome c biogenesis protein CcdA [Streptococcus suis]MDY7593385.1 cytochrome c biogenesis protein CcdA [Streptococcus suis]NQQ29173.1 cytochrome C biogenesis protein CcdA [Streptococcus suis]HEL2253880.1 sulfite exporter TauE/SafE family protein [Streptococcus suis]HEL2406061.1 sulfite exporter TauE/SafE family protein [Streptococcus suis]HEM3165787.1 sulfite exporter TauE/SafE family protein [Streptococcus suis 92-1191]
MAFQWFTVLALFAEGLLSFLSPCVLPILPIYVGLLAGGAEGKAGEKKVLVNTLSFVVGIALTFFLLGFASSLLSRVLQANAQFLQIISGLLIVLMGILQLGWFNIPMLEREFSTKNKVYQAGKQVTPYLAFLMGFTFSFSWTPCIGPILASVFIYASSQQGWLSGILLLVYCLGFILPFILVAFFSQKMLAFFKNNRHYLAWTKRISGYLLLLIGLSILTGFFQHLVRFFQ